MQTLGEQLIRHGYSLSSTESFTVGRFGAAIGAVPGISAVYKGSLTCYMTEIKRDVLGVDEDILNTYGSVSAQCAKDMCIKGRELFGSDICVSFTGNAGPDVMEDKKVGEVYIGVDWMGGVDVHRYQLSGSRTEIAEKAVHIAEELLLKKLAESK